VKIILILNFLLFLSAWGDVDQDWSLSQEWKDWEKLAFSSLPTDKGQLFSLYMTAASLMETHGVDDKAENYYQMAWGSSYTGDKSEAILRLVFYARNDKLKLKSKCEEARAWFKKYPTLLNPIAAKWLALMETHALGKTEISPDGFLGTWSTDARVKELMTLGKSVEAYALISNTDPAQSDINKKLRFDLLATLSLEKKSWRPLYCLSVLKNHRKSYSWTMRLCRLLESLHKGEKPAEKVEDIKSQLSLEDPDRLYWINLVEKL
jgi:hypothetical protein